MLKRVGGVAAVLVALVVVGAAGAGCSSSSSSSPPATSPAQQLTTGLKQLVAMPGGPVGAIAVVQTKAGARVSTAGVADRATGQPVTDGDFMRLASVAKAYNGAVALSLVQQGKLALSGTIGQLLPGQFPAWSAITVAQLLQHTSGLPDYTKSPGFVAQLTADPTATITPPQIVGFVANQPPLFAPGSRYHYSDTDNIVVGLIVEAVTGQSYESELAATVYTPLSLTDTSLPSTTAMGQPTLRGYAVPKGQPPEDITTALSPSGAWASGGMVSTPSELNTFMRAYVAGRLFGPTVQHQQLQFVPGSSGPPGPGVNSAGLAIYRYQTKCGTVFGHTGNFPGYTMFAAATPDGSRSVVVAVNTQLNDKKPVSAAYTALRNVESTAVCAALAG
ncbi:MAG TPA: serine hydrolase domain-containing protein [Acidimicrobiales bacterium]|nr:serine hydrolase domain-containing protein [Acidimicrobiales bacterium]